MHNNAKKLEEESFYRTITEAIPKKDTISCSLCGKSIVDKIAWFCNEEPSVKFCLSCAKVSAEGQVEADDKVYSWSARKI